MVGNVGFPSGSWVIDLPSEGERASAVVCGGGGTKSFLEILHSLLPPVLILRPEVTPSPLPCFLSFLSNLL